MSQRSDRKQHIAILLSQTNCRNSYITARVVFRPMWDKQGLATCGRTQHEWQSEERPAAQQ